MTGKTLLVDPPRAGVDEGTLRLMGMFDNVIYISCNPETLATNLEQVKDGFKVERMAVFD